MVGSNGCETYDMNRDFAKYNCLIAVFLLIIRDISAAVCILNVSTFD